MRFRFSYDITVLLYFQEKTGKRLCLFLISFFSHCSEGVLLRGGRTEGFRRHPSASTGLR